MKVSQDFQVSLEWNGSDAGDSTPYVHMVMFHLMEVQNILVLEQLPNVQRVQISFFLASRIWRLLFTTYWQLSIPRNSKNNPSNHTLLLLHTRFARASLLDLHLRTPNNAVHHHLTSSVLGNTIAASRRPSCSTIAQTSAIIAEWFGILVKRCHKGVAARTSAVISKRISENRREPRIFGDFWVQMRSTTLIRLSLSLNR
jgi:hypothetical protein